MSFDCSCKVHGGDTGMLSGKVFTHLAEKGFKRCFYESAIPLGRQILTRLSRCNTPTDLMEWTIQTKILLEFMWSEKQALVCGVKEFAEMFDDFLFQSEVCFFSYSLLDLLIYVLAKFTSRRKRNSKTSSNWRSVDKTLRDISGGRIKYQSGCLLYEPNERQRFSCSLHTIVMFSKHIVA